MDINFRNALKDDKAQILLLAIVYWLTGKLGLFLAIPPGYATVFWPASGIALAAVYHAGYRILPGVFLGSALLNFFQSVTLLTHLSFETAFANSFIIGIGASFQAFLGSRLITKAVGVRNRLEQLPSIVWFMLLGGPVSCLAGASIGTCILIITQTVPIENAFFSWWTWYTGDVLGVLVFGPLLVLFLNKDVLLRRKRAVGFPLFILFIIVIGFFLGIRQWDKRQAAIEFAKDSKLIGAEIEKQFSAYLQEIQSMQSFYEASENVERKEFTAFVSPAFRRTPGIIALSWVPKISDKNRDWFIKKVRSSGLPNYEIKEKGHDSKLKIAPKREEYFPSEYVEPFDQFHEFIGFNLGSEVRRLAALHRARDNNIAVVSDRIHLLSDKSPDVYGFLITLPIYKKKMPIETVEQRRKALQGFVVGGFRFKDVVEPIMKEWQGWGINVRLVLDRPENKEILYNDKILGANPSGLPPGIAAFSQRILLSIFNNEWYLECYKMQNYVLAHTNWTIWVTLATGIFFTALTGIFLLYMTGRSAEIEQIVKDRTDQLKQQRQFLELAMAATQDGVWDWDQNHRTLWLSPRWKAMLGYKDEEIINTLSAAEKVIHPHDLESWRNGISDYMTGKNRDFQGIFRFFHKDGSILYVLSRAIGERNEDGRIVRLVGAHTDVTEIERSKIELEKAKNEADSASRAKSDFLANMSHEIRTPMNGVIGMAHLLMDTPLDSRQLHYCQTIARSADSLLQIINDILDFSKIEAGRMELENVPFDFQQLCEEVSDLMFVRTQEKDIEFLLSWKPGCPAFISGDPGRIRQVLFNICGNAIKFTEKGHVLLDIKCTEVNNEFVTILISVSDTGIGISKADQERIFNKFDQADTSTTRRYGGTGLGLAITKQLITLMGGSIKLESEQGKGSTFSFHLTLCRADERDIPANRIVHRDFKGQGLRALVVDDNDVACEIMEKYLSATGMDVEVENNPLNALDRLRKASNSGKAFSFVITDYAMPDLDGVSLAASISGKEEYKNISLILVTSQPNRSDADIILRSGISAYLTKPVHPSELSAVLSMLFNAKQQGLKIPLVTRFTIADTETQRKIIEKVWFDDVKALIVEDNETNQEVLDAMMENFGIFSTIAVNGQEALARLGENNFDIVLMDCQMPVMDGFEATQIIREKSRWKDLPIIALTANAMKGDKEKCIDAGMNDYIAKPVKESELEQMLLKWLSSSRQSYRPQKVKEIASSLILPATIDHSVIKELQIFTGDKFKLIVDTFIANSGRLMRLLSDSFASQDEGALVRAAHSLKSSAGQMGAIKLQELMSHIEALSRHGQIMQALRFFEHAQKEYTEVLAFYETIIKPA